MKSYDNRNPNAEIPAGKTRRGYPHATSVSPKERLEDKLRREAFSKLQVVPHVLPPPPGDSPQLLASVHALMDHAAGAPLAPEVAPIVLDPDQRCLLLVRSFAALGNLGLNSEDLLVAQERFARIVDTALQVVKGEGVA